MIDSDEFLKTPNRYGMNGDISEKKPDELKGLIDQKLKRDSNAVPLDHGKFGIMQPSGFFSSEHMAELINIPDAFGRGAVS